MGRELNFSKDIQMVHRHSSFFRIKQLIFSYMLWLFNKRHTTVKLYEYYPIKGSWYTNQTPLATLILNVITA